MSSVRASIERPGSTAELVELEVALPAALQRYGRSVRATSLGPPDAPALVVMGGISSNRYPALAPAGSSGWWPAFAGRGGAADPDRYRVIGLDFIADDSGQSAPTTYDQAIAVAEVLDQFGIERPRALIGASYGGMTALAFAELFPTRTDHLVVISAAEAPHPTATAARELQRRVVKLGLDGGCEAEALAIARGMAMLTYRSPLEFEARFVGGIQAEDPLTHSEPGLYLQARGDAFRSIMSPQRFLSLSAAIDRHRVDPSRINCAVLIIGAQTDQLVPPAQLSNLADRLPKGAELRLLHSVYGHDMFLKEAAAISALVRPFVETAS